jgi:hypothetical protein
LLLLVLNGHGLAEIVCQNFRSVRFILPLAAIGLSFTEYMETSIRMPAPAYKAAIEPGEFHFPANCSIITETKTSDWQ